MSNLDALPDFVRTNKLKLANIRSSSDSNLWEDRIEDATSEEANLVTSIAWDGGGKEAVLHYPLLDIDFPAALVPSTTPDHYHLFLKKALPWSTYSNLLLALVEAGIIEYGVYTNAMDRKYTSLRMPHVKKGDEKLNHPFKSEKEQQVEDLRNKINELTQELNKIMYDGDPF